MKSIKRLESLLKEQVSLQKKLLWEANTSRKYQEVIRVAVTAPILREVQEFSDQRQLSFLHTLSTIRDEGLSFSRFGDGEMKLLLRPDYKLKFQANSPRLAEALRSVLIDEDNSSPALLIGFPHVYRDLHWSGVWSDVWWQMKPLFEQHVRVGNSHVSRPIFFQSTKAEGVQAWREIWENKKITIITGENSRFKAIPQLFDNTRSVDYIYSLATNAFDHLDSLVKEVNTNKSDIFLISLGPAGTVLTKEIAKMNRQAIDIGHISDSYENVFEDGIWPESKSITQS